ncbi:MAG: DNA topoisomerase I [Candidatus Diapherotrites archaeon CG11_big_fil_rev_8_21_14_0_20_37_9]|nr:MAG: DNA topoisomerase I [Candidatus Diapherotrites archaeon CG11_big_fil_rev_8_21_14_0_20_37_9]
MKLIISEKAIAGKNLATHLALGTVSAVSIGAAQSFKFSGSDGEYVVVPLRGHISDVEFPKKYSHWVGTDLKALTNAEILYSGREIAIISALKKVAKDADEVIIATDADREGESIGVEALNYVKEANPKIKIKRAYFSAITKKDISDAFSKLTDVDYNFADSADSRREIDLIWGAVLTRFLSLVTGRLGKEYLSVGRVQTPTLALIVKREKERNAFKSKKYWELKAILEKNSKQFEAEHKNGKFWDKNEAEDAFAAKDAFAIVQEIKSIKRILKRPTPFNTTDFLRQATTIGFSAGQAMEIAEQLYQQGYTSYPRTDNTVYPATIDLRKILEEISTVSEFNKEANFLLGQKKLEPSTGKKETKDHPPIYPVTAAPKSKLSEKQWKIYELIVRRFFATLSDDAVTENQSVDFLIGKEPYVARGQKILEPGWKAVYPYSSLTEVFLPEMKQGDKVKVVDTSMLDKETQPPARYSQSALLKLMEDLGIGTKSTRHTIIQKLYNRRYIVGAKAVEPSKVAFAVIHSLESNEVDVVEAKMTALLEQEMDLIVAGKKSKKDVVDESRALLLEVLERMLEKKDKIGSELRVALREDSVVGPCDKCDGFLRTLMSRNKKRFLGCTNYPKCTNTYPLPQKGKVVPEDKLCEKCGTPVIKVFGQRYRFEMCVNPDCVTKADWKSKSNAKKEPEKATEEN